MPSAEIDLPDKLDSEITQLVEQGEFLNRDQAVENLLSMGISVYEETGSESDEPAEEVFGQTAEEHQDPALDDDPSSEGYTF